MTEVTRYTEAEYRNAVQRAVASAKGAEFTMTEKRLRIGEVLNRRPAGRSQTAEAKEIAKQMDGIVGWSAASVSRYATVQRVYEVQEGFARRELRTFSLDKLANWQKEPRRVVKEYSSLADRPSREAKAEGAKGTGSAGVSVRFDAKHAAMLTTLAKPGESAKDTAERLLSTAFVAAGLTLERAA
jgi:hypothetical protein